MTPGLNPMEVTGDRVVSDILSYLEKHSAESYYYVARGQFERLIFSARYLEKYARRRTQSSTSAAFHTLSRPI